MPKAVDGSWVAPEANPNMRERLYRCPECFDCGWVVAHDDDEAPTMKPCRHCRPVVYGRWQDGHYVPGHSCDECNAIRAGRATVHDYTESGEYLGASSTGY